MWIPNFGRNSYLRLMKIYIDGDGCPVKDETYKVAARYKIQVLVVANKWLKLPPSSLIEMIVVGGDFNAADDWIVNASQPFDIVITADLLLADRCLKKHVGALGPKGFQFTEDNIGQALASRELMTNLRHMGENHGGPAPMDKKSKSQFLSQLDRMIQQFKRGEASK